MVMAIVKEQGDEGLPDEMLLAALDAAMARGLGPQQQQQQQHPLPPLTHSASQKKLTITHQENWKPLSPPVAHHQSLGFKKEAAAAAKAALVEEQRDEDLHDEMLLAALDAAMARRLSLKQQQKHSAPSLIYSAPQKKLTITHHENSKPLSPPGAHHQSLCFKKEGAAAAKAPQMSNGNQRNFQIVHREFRSSPGDVEKDLVQPGFASNVREGACNWSGGPAAAGPDANASGLMIRRGGGGRLKSTNGAAEWSAVRQPLQELQPWVGSCHHNVVAKAPSSTSAVWVQAEKASCLPKECSSAWFSGLNGVAMFKECQEAAMRVGAGPFAHPPILTESCLGVALDMNGRIKLHLHSALLAHLPILVEGCRGNEWLN